VSFSVRAISGCWKQRSQEDAGGNGKAVQWTMDWICSFNLPVITLCAFIVLNIFLQLFNLIFQWLMFIKICIPFPRPEAE
jgi:hypothetical protein